MQPVAIAAVYFTSLTTVLSSVTHASAAINRTKPVSNVTVTTNNTSVSAPNPTRLDCNGDLYKRDLRKRSCINAQRGMADDRDWFSVGPRRGPMFTDVEMPYRWISGMKYVLNNSYRSRVNFS